MGKLVGKKWPSNGLTLKRKHPKILKKLAIAFAIVFIGATLYLKVLQPHTLEAHQRIKLESTQSQLIETRKQLNQTKATNEAEEKARAKELEEVNKKLQEAEKQLQAKRDGQSQTAYAAEAPQKPAATYPLPEDEAKAFIYSHESGNNPGAVNSIGCAGLGQACPGSKLPCSLSDYACQDAYFTNYMLSRYGSWNAARAFWLANGWW